MKELLRAHEQDIIDRVVLQLRTQPPLQPTVTSPNSPVLHSHHPGIQPIQYCPPSGTQPPPPNSTATRIAELESQLAQLRAANLPDQSRFDQRHLGTSYPTQYPIEAEGESARGIVTSVETLFPGVERSTLVQIVENRFKLTNIYRLLASEKERAETHPTINIGGVEFEQMGKEGKESKYRISGFFKAWAAYCGILIKLAPYGLQGELGTALAIYTINLYDLLEKYSWEGVRAYHFQFHRKRVASGKDIYYPTEWRQLDSQLIASKCFAYPAPRFSWAPTQKPTPGQTYSSATHTFPPPERRNNYSLQNPTRINIVPPGAQPHGATAQPCRNWNYRECTTSPCRYQHSCITCGSNHWAAQCTLGNNGQLSSSRMGQFGR